MKDFLSERKIAVKINRALSGSYKVENGTPQGSIISPLLFFIMINDVFKSIESSTGVVLFADNGALWKKRRNVQYVVNKRRKAIDIVEKWALEWGFRLSVDKTKTIFLQEGKKTGFKAKNMWK